MNPPTMKWWMVVAIVITIVRIADAAEAGPPLTIDLQMRNNAQVPAHVLEQSQDGVTRIFAGAGLAVRWTETAPRFTVQIVPQVLGFNRASSPVMGVALRRASGSMAQVFFRQVQGFAHAYDVDLGTMLGCVIAHEIGHLLMPGNAHSPRSVMQADWDKALVRDAARGSLTFTEAQAARIRASL
jgi:hypothetical protein